MFVVALNVIAVADAAEIRSACTVEASVNVQFGVLMNGNAVLNVSVQAVTVPPPMAIDP